jgi:hypothetical protein
VAPYASDWPALREGLQLGRSTWAERFVFSTDLAHAAWIETVLRKRA